MMNLIPTTHAAANRIKSNAKKIKKAQHIQHMAALELAAVEAGYESWFHVNWCLKQTVAGELIQQGLTEQL